MTPRGTGRNAKSFSRSEAIFRRSHPPRARAKRRGVRIRPAYHFFCSLLEASSDFTGDKSRSSFPDFHGICTAGAPLPSTPIPLSFTFYHSETLVSCKMEKFHQTIQRRENMENCQKPLKSEKKFFLIEPPRARPKFPSLECDGFGAE